MVTIDEIMMNLSDSLLKSVVVHEDYADCFDCLGLTGYKSVGEYYSKASLKNYRKIHKFYVEKYKKVVPSTELLLNHDIVSFEEDKSYIIRSTFDKWIEFISDLKQNFEKMYISCVEIGELDSSIVIGEYINFISEEEKIVCSIFQNIKSLDFSSDCIADEQNYYKDLYKSRKNFGLALA